MKLFLVHCGFYDNGLMDGIYETHVNFVIPAISFEEARVKVKQEPEFQKWHMHVDGLQRIDALKGYRIHLAYDPQLEGQSILESSRHRDLAPKNRGTEGHVVSPPAAH